MFLNVTSIGIKPTADIRPPDVVPPSLYAHEVLLKQIYYDTAFLPTHSIYRHKLRLTKNGTILAFDSTCFNLYRSE
jgi:hypothetical protein